jgi:hypothetical protein
MARSRRKLRAAETYAQSELLFARPSFWEGVGSLFGWGASLRDFDAEIDNARALDMRAIAADWRAVGEDLWQVAPRPLQSRRHAS